MDDRAALEELPAPYATALRLDARGASAELIADALAIPSGAVPEFLQMARRKLERVQRAADQMSPNEVRKAPKA